MVTATWLDEAQIGAQHIRIHLAQKVIISGKEDEMANRITHLALWGCDGTTVKSAIAHRIRSRHVRGTVVIWIETFKVTPTV